jgi:hypothetical protein
MECKNCGRSVSLLNLDRTELIRIATRGWYCKVCGAVHAWAVVKEEETMGLEKLFGADTD